MAVTFWTKVIGGVTLIVTVIFGELYVYSLHWEAKARILRAHFVAFVEAFLLILTRFVWNNFSDFLDGPKCESVSASDNQRLKKVKYSDNNLYAKSFDVKNEKWTKWKIFLFTYLLSCHLSYFTNFYFIGREPHVVAYCCYAALGLLFQIVTGQAIAKVLFFILRKVTKTKTSLVSKSRELQLVLLYALFVWTYGVYNASSPPTVKEVTIPVKGLPQSLGGMKIIQISDVHLGPTVGRWRLNRIVSIINKQNPDIVVMTGDLVDGSVHTLKEAAEPLKDVQSKYGKYFISGNHEYYTGDVDNWFAHLGGLGFVVLHNSNVKLPSDTVPAKEQICLAGTDDIEALRIGYGKHGMNLDLALGSCDERQPVVLLAHQPRAAKQALDSDYRVDLVISGHTHGGQFFPITFVAYFFNPFYHGLYKYGKSSHVYVSMGTQYWGIPVRIGTTMEITHIILHKA